MNVARSLSVVNNKSAKYASRMKTSVATTFAMIAPTKNPSSRLKMTPQESQRCFKLKGLWTIDARPQTGHFNLRLRPKVIMIVRGSRFIQSGVCAEDHDTERLHPRLALEPPPFSTGHWFNLNSRATCYWERGRPCPPEPKAMLLKCQIK